jgi:hypothetical protein
MYVFRLKEPLRRANRKECELYSSYRKTLEEDFNKRCGYCDDSNEYRMRNFAIDHFVPQNPVDFVNDIAPNYYYNLVYSCNFCNSSKSNKWPTRDCKVYNDGKSGFIEPTTVDYTNLFKRNSLGEIICNGNNPDIAKYVIRELNLWYPVHHITWKLERVKKLGDEVKAKILNVIDADIRKELESTHYEILQEIEGLYQNLFTTINEK